MYVLFSMYIEVYIECTKQLYIYLHVLTYICTCIERTQNSYVYISPRNVYLYVCNLVKSTKLV